MTPSSAFRGSVLSSQKGSSGAGTEADKISIDYKYQLTTQEDEGEGMRAIMDDPLRHEKREMKKRRLKERI